MPTYEELRLRTGQVIAEDWYDTLIYVLEDITERGAVSYEGYVHKDLIPDTDLLFNLGIPTSRFKEIHMGYGYASYGFYVEGKPVLKDGDPISIYNIEDLAKTKITEAINDSYITDYTQPLHSDLLNIKSLFEPNLIGKLINFSASALTDLFTPDLTISKSGRARLKFTLSTDAYAYVKWTPSGEAVSILSLLNAGVQIPANAWHEFDFTVMENDKINVQVDRTLTITIAVYNIPNA